MGKTSEPGSGGQLSGRFYVDTMNDDELAQGWIVKEVNAGLFLVQTFVRVAGQLEKVLRVVHPIEMKGWLFFESLEQAQRYCDQKVIETLPDIDVTPILADARDELQDTVLDELKKAKEQGKLACIKELMHLLETLVK
jgi:hypothetical protein